MALIKKAFENFVGKGENSGNHTTFSTLQKTEIIIVATLNMWYANAFSLEESKNLLFGVNNMRDRNVDMSKMESICRRKIQHGSNNETGHKITSISLFSRPCFQKRSASGLSSNQFTQYHMKE